MGGLLLLISLHVNATTPLYPNQVKQLLTEAPRLVMLWSVDCPPCYKELSMLEDLLKTHPQLPITLIATDDDSSRYSEIEALHQRLHGEQLQKRVFAELAASQIRFAIDPTWTGVLPRSYFISHPGQLSGHSGALNAKHILDWLKTTVE